MVQRLTVISLVRLALLLALVGSFLVPAPVRAQRATPNSLPVPGKCVDGKLPGGALSRICVPAKGWNGDLIVYAHGYVPFNAPLDFYNLDFGDGTDLSLLVQSLGFAFATTSYRRNGLAILEGVQDVRELVAKFGKDVRPPRMTYIAGASEGGAVTALSVERSPDVFDGGLSLCGPIGDFRKQVNYWGDFRVLYDYYFPGVLPAGPLNIPDEVIQGWNRKYQSLIVGTMTKQPKAAAQLLRTSQASFDAKQAASPVMTTAGLLWYNVFATNDGKQQLGGNPFDNSTRVYRGSADDAKLNASVQRFKADPKAVAALRQYDTTGNPQVPLIAMHTTGDPIIPYWHASIYGQKTRARGNTKVTQIAVDRYGHCNFTGVEVADGFRLMVLKATGQELVVPG